MIRQWLRRAKIALNDNPDILFSVFLIVVLALQTALLMLRLLGVIRWDWLWVFAPVWMPWLLSGVILFIAMVIIWIQD